MSCLKLLSARKMHSSSRNPLICGNSSLEHSKIWILSNPIFTEFVQCSKAKAWHTCENLCIYYLLIPSPIATAECGLEMNRGHLPWQCNLAKTDTTFVWLPYMLFVYSLSPNTYEIISCGKLGMHEVQSQCMEKHPNTFFLWDSQYILEFTDQILHVEHRVYNPLQFKPSM
jgi:hypothetical protein